MATLPERERRLVSLYYFGEVTMKQIGAELGVNESRVSQLHARAIQRLRAALEPGAPAPTGAAVPRPVITALTPRVPMAARPVLPFARPTMAKAAAAAARPKRRTCWPTRAARARPAAGRPA